MRCVGVAQMCIQWLFLFAMYIVCGVHIVVRGGRVFDENLAVKNQKLLPLKADSMTFQREDAEGLVQYITTNFRFA